MYTKHNDTPEVECAYCETIFEQLSCNGEYNMIVKSTAQRCVRMGDDGTSLLLMSNPCCLFVCLGPRVIYAAVQRRIVMD